MIPGTGKAPGASQSAGNSLRGHGSVGIGIRFGVPGCSRDLGAVSPGSLTIPAWQDAKGVSNSWV